MFTSSRNSSIYLRSIEKPNLPQRIGDWRLQIDNDDPGNYSRHERRGAGTRTVASLVGLLLIAGAGITVTKVSLEQLRDSSASARREHVEEVMSRKPDDQSAAVTIHTIGNGQYPVIAADVYADGSDKIAELADEITIIGTKGSQNQFVKAGEEIAIIREQDGDIHAAPIQNIPKDYPVIDNKDYLNRFPQQ